MGRLYISQTVVFLIYLFILIYLLYQSSLFLAATGQYLQKLADEVAARNNQSEDAASPVDVGADNQSPFRPSLERWKYRIFGSIWDQNEKHQGPNTQGPKFIPPKNFNIPLKLLLRPWAVNCSGVIQTAADPNASKPLTVFQEEIRGSSGELAVILKSRPEEYFQRQAVRNTWGAAFRGRLTFLIGRPPYADQLADQLDAAIRLEWERYGDILFVDFLDTYYNLSLKFLASLNYMSKECGGASFYLHGDTDALIYPDNAKEFVHKRVGRQRSIYGLCWAGARVLRDGKWEMAQKNYISTYYPNYCAGGSFFMTGDVPKHLLSVLDKNRQYFQIDDVFFTGILAEKALIRRVKTPGIYLLRHLIKMKDCECLRLLATFEYRGPDALVSAWKKFLKETKECLP